MTWALVTTYELGKMIPLPAPIFVMICTTEFETCENISAGFKAFCFEDLFGSVEPITAVAVGSVVGVAVGGTSVAVGVTVGSGFGVAVGSVVGVAVGSTVGVAVGIGIGVGVAAEVGIAVGVAVGVGIAVGVAVGESTFSDATTVGVKG